jgi:hypothetical protein
MSLEKREELEKEVWGTHDKLEALRKKQISVGLSDEEDLELRNLDVKFYNLWSELKD